MRIPFVILLLSLLLPAVARAAPEAILPQSTLWEDTLRFLNLQDASLRWSLAGMLLVGLNCGLLGGFVLVRRMALVGDMLSHAVLPGVVIGFLWTQSKDPLLILVSSLGVAFLAIGTQSLLLRTTRLKPDAVQGLVLASFYGVGVCLLGLVQQLPTSAKGGVESFLFGQAAGLSAADIQSMGVSSLIALALIIWLYHDLLLLSFHRGYGETLGLRMKLMHTLIMALTAFAIVVAMQAVGIVLVSAMLIIPAATAHLLTDRMHRLLILSCGIGMVAALAGAFGSFLGARVPAGPVMVLAGAGFFALAFLFSPRHGWLMRLLRQTRRQQREERENTLKTMHRVLEDRHPQIQLEEGVSLRELSQRLGEAGAHIDARARDLIRSGLATLDATESELFFTPEGQKRARAVVRNHRLWELYLTHAAAFAPDHVHDQAEEIEHLLGEETVRQLSRRLDYPTRDPHGRPIPAMEDIHPEATDAAAPNPKPLGYQG